MVKSPKVASEEAPSQRILIYEVQEENGSHIQHFALDLTPPPEVIYKSEPGTSDGMNVLGIVMFSATMGMCCPPHPAVPGSRALPAPTPPCTYPAASSTLSNLEPPIFQAVPSFPIQWSGSSPPPRWSQCSSGGILHPVLVCLQGCGPSLKEDHASGPSCS